jgi:hypothetical protein
MIGLYHSYVSACRSFLFALLLVVAITTHSVAQPGTLDMSFDPGEGADFGVRAITIQSESHILIGGDFGEFNGTKRDGFARLLWDGSLDAGFQPSLGNGGEAYAIAIQPADGKILVGGYFTDVNGVARSCLARFSSEGLLDTAFTIQADDAVYAVATWDERCFVAGDFWSLSRGATEYDRNYVARFDGNTVKRWNLPGDDWENGPDWAVYALAVLGEGMIKSG